MDGGSDPAGTLRVRRGVGAQRSRLRALVGSHTGEGRELALGFAVKGLIDESSDGALTGVMTKGGMRPGDVLILTKPIGTGTLLAAHAQLKARGRWIGAALASMQVLNQAAVACLIQHGARACTDPTGFGLLGHLVKMIKPSGVDAELELDALPLLEGARETAAAEACLAALHAPGYRQATRIGRVLPPEQASEPIRLVLGRNLE